MGTFILNGGYMEREAQEWTFLWNGETWKLTPYCAGPGERNQWPDKDPDPGYFQIEWTGGVSQPLQTDYRNLQDTLMKLYEFLTHDEGYGGCFFNHKGMMLFDFSSINDGLDVTPRRTRSMTRRINGTGACMCPHDHATLEK